MTAVIVDFLVVLVPLRLELLLSLPLRVEGDHLPKVVVYDVRLIQLGSEAVHPGTVAPGDTEHIIADKACEQALAVFSADEEEYLTKLRVALFILDAEYRRDKSLLPQLQLDAPGSQRSLDMKAVRLHPIDSGIGGVLIEKEALFLDPAHEHLVNEADPAPHGHSSTLDCLIVCKDCVFSGHVGAFSVHVPRISLDVR